MGFTRYTQAESSAPISKKGHEDIEEELRKVGKTSMSQMNSVERNKVSKTLDTRS